MGAAEFIAVCLGAGVCVRLLVDGLADLWSLFLGFIRSV